MSNSSNLASLDLTNEDEKIELELEQESEVKNDVVAIDMSNSSNLASLELTTEDENKKQKIKYKSLGINMDKQFKYGYAYMHTDFWDVPMKRQPVCKNKNPCKICPRQTTGFEKDLMKWD